MRLEKITAIPHPSGNRIDLKWVNPQPDEYPVVRVVRHETMYPASHEDGIRVAEDTAFLFGIAQSFQSDLDYGALSIALRLEFLGKQILLSNNATVASTTPGIKWRISDGDKTYFVKNSETMISVYSEGLISASDTNLKGETVYYYTLFLSKGSLPYVYDAYNRISVMATSPYNMAEQMMELLPAIYHRYDTVLPKNIPPGMQEEDKQRGQLRRFLDLPGSHLDQLYSFASAMLYLHNRDKVNGSMLPLLAQWIGWQNNVSQDLNFQRNEIQQAPELYKTVGIMANLRSFVNRLTNWDSQIKEFVHNVFTSNNPERLTIWSQKAISGNWSPAELVSLDFAYEGSSSLLVDTYGRIWLFYHTKHGEQWDIWYKIYDSGKWSPGYRVTRSNAINKYPAALKATAGSMWLFWSAYDSAGWNIKTNILAVGRVTTKAQLTSKGRSGTFPLVDGSTLVISVDGAKQNIVTFKASDFPNISTVTIADVVTTLNRKVPGLTASAGSGDTIQLNSKTTGEGSSLLIDVDASTAALSLGFGSRFPNVLQSATEPTAFQDNNGDIWLFWSSHREGHWDIWYNKFGVAGWGTEKQLTSGSASNREPAGVFFSATNPINNTIWIFWSRKGHEGWNIYYRTKPNTNLNDTFWNPEVELSPIPPGQKYDNREPAVSLDNQGNILVFWSSNRTGSSNIWYKTFDKALNTWTAEKVATSGHFTKKAPSALSDRNGNTWLLFRSNESIVYSSSAYPFTTCHDSRYSGSTVIDTRNRERISGHGKLTDVLHYVYDTGKENEDWYARDTLGVYLTPDTANQQLINRGEELAKDILEKFLPVQLRVVFIINPTAYKELIYTYDFPATEPQSKRFIDEKFSDSIATTAREAYSGLADRHHQDTVRGWIWLRSWSEEYTSHHTVDFTATPIDMKFRTWHIGLQSGG